MKGKKVRYVRDDGASATGIVLAEGTTFCLVQGNHPSDMFLEWLPKKSRRAWLEFTTPTTPQQ